MISIETVYGASFHIVALFISLSALIFNLLERRPDTRKSFVFDALLLVLVLSSLSSTMMMLFWPHSNDPDPLTAAAAQSITAVCQIIYFTAHTALPTLFYFYVLFVTGDFYRQKRSRRFFNILPIITAEVFVITNPWTHFVWYFDKDWEFHRGTGEIIVYLVAALYIIMAAVNIFLYWRAVTFRRRWAMAYAFGLTVAGVTIQMLLKEVRVELPLEALSLVGILVTVEKEEDRIDLSTGVYNRNALRMDINNYFRMERSFHLLCVRIINADVLQRIAGSSGQDALIGMISKYLSNIHTRYEIYHVTPSSFMLICHGFTDEEAEHLAGVIRERFQRTWLCRGVDVRLNAAILCADCPRDIALAEDVFLLADGAIEEVETGALIRSDELKFLKRKAEVEDALTRGFDEHEFEVIYQPIYQTEKKTIVAAEASLRLHDVKLGEILPEEFMPIAKKNETLDRLGMLLLDEVCAFLNTGIPVGMRMNSICVGMISMQCIHPDFVPGVRKILERYNIRPSQITLEIRELGRIHEVELLQQTLTELKELGFKIALDRYGAGDSSLQSMLSVAFDMVNMSIQKREGKYSVETGKSILSNGVRMVQGLGKKILVRGVSRQEHVDILEKLKVDYLQGDFYSKAVNQNELIALLRVTEIAWREEQRARAQSEAKSNFLANMSHEIRTPINAILGMNEMILRESGDETILSYARDIERAGNSLLSLISDILDFSKIEAGSMEIVESEYGLSSVLNDVVNMVQVKMSQKGLVLYLDVDNTLPEMLYGDEMRLRQIIINVMNNAVKYTDKGSITLSVHGVYSNDTEDVLELLVDVKDTGVGIREEDIGRLFGTFQRLDMIRNKTVEGTGLGLAITSSLLHMMGGEITVDSTYGEGSTFHICLPQFVVDRSEMGDLKERYIAHAKSRPDYHEKFVAPDAKILVVDDTQINLTVFQGLLKQTLVQIDTCTSGAECLEMIHKKHYDVIFLDYRMPEMDGLETLHRMKAPADHENVDTPVICLTANVVSGAKESFIMEGFDDYLAKPIDSRKLERMLVQYLPREKVEIHEEELKDDAAEEASSGETLQEETAAVPESPVLTQLRSIDEINPDMGLERCGTEESYLEILKIYYDSIESKAEEIRQFLEEEDWKNYTIRVHSLKSTSRVIGAEKLGDAAAALEAAGESGDDDMIKKRTPVILKDLFALKDRLRPLYEEEDKDLPEAEEETLHDAFTALEEFADSMDFENAAFVLEELKGYRLKEEDAGLVRELQTALDSIDFDRISEILAKRKEAQSGN